jgi:ACS family hexuronate transporter-like MFS transporter
LTHTNVTLSPEPQAGPLKATGWAWGLCWLMFACTVLNYMDRQAMAVVGPLVKAEFQLDNVWFGWVGAAFQLTYAFCQWPAGYFVDRWDVRKTYAAAVAWWSLAGIATAFSPTLGVLLACRALLGMGESFNWPCALRVTSHVLPPAERSLGNGIFNSGAAVGAVLTPLVVVPMATALGWRVPFLVLGALGLVWVVAWLALSAGRPAMVGTAQARPADSGLPAAAKGAFGGVVALALAVAATWFWFGLPALWWGVAVLMIGLLLVARAAPAHWLEGADWARSLGAITRRRRFWVMVAVGCTVNVSWHFLVYWMANFFQEGRRLGPLVGGMVTALPFLAADGGNLLGGGAVRVLVRRGWSTGAARKIVLCVCMVLISSAVWVGVVVAGTPQGPAGVEIPPSGSSLGTYISAVLSAIRGDGLIIALLSLAALGTAAYMVNYFAFGQDVAPRHTGLVIGYLGGLGNLFAAGFLPLAGWITKGPYGFAPNFVIVGVLPLAGLLTLLAFWGRDEAS